MQSDHRGRNAHAGLWWQRLSRKAVICAKATGYKISALYQTNTKNSCDGYITFMHVQVRL